MATSTPSNQPGRQSQFAQGPAPDAATGAIARELFGRLSARGRLTVAFPPCANELLALVRDADADDISGFFREYFALERHRIFGQDRDNVTELDTLFFDARDGLDGRFAKCVEGSPIERRVPAWPTDCCLCSPCVTLRGDRNRPKD